MKNEIFCVKLSPEILSYGRRHVCMNCNGICIRLTFVFRFLCRNRMQHSYNSGLFTLRDLCPELRFRFHFCSYGKMATKEKSVKENTFKKWPWFEEFVYDLDDEGLITNVRCLVCSEYWEAIDRRAVEKGVKGPARIALKSYVDGVPIAHKSSMNKHVEGTMHCYGKQLKAENDKTMTDNPSTEKVTSPNMPGLQSVKNVLDATSTETYKRIVRSVLYIVRSNGSLRSLENLVNLQKENGLKFLQGKVSKQACKEFMKILARIVRSDITKILDSAKFVSALSDGSEARKTKEEKELVYVRCVTKNKWSCVSEKGSCLL